MKGYRTLGFASLTLLIGLVGRHVAPELLDQYLDVIFAAIAVGIVGLRLVTTTAFGQRVEHDLGLSDTAVTALRSLAEDLPDSSMDIRAAVSDLNAAVARLTGHPLFDPATLAALCQVAATIPVVAESAGGGPLSGFTPGALQPVRVTSGTDVLSTPMQSITPAA